MLNVTVIYRIIAFYFLQMTFISHDTLYQTPMLQASSVIKMSRQPYNYSHNQFGYKSNHCRCIYIYSIKNVAQYYKQQNSSVFGTHFGLLILQ